MACAAAPAERALAAGRRMGGVGGSLCLGLGARALGTWSVEVRSQLAVERVERARRPAIQHTGGCILYRESGLFRGLERGLGVHAPPARSGVSVRLTASLAQGVGADLSSLFSQMTDLSIQMCTSILVTMHPPKLVQDQHDATPHKQPILTRISHRTAADATS